MPAIGNITLADHTPGTPISHTFAPVTVDGNIARWANRVGGIPIGYETMELSIRPPSPKSLEKMYLVTLKIKAPTLDVTSPSTTTGIQPAPSVGYTNIAELKFWVSERSTDVERGNLQYLLGNMVLGSVFESVIEGLESVY